MRRRPLQQMIDETRRWLNEHQVSDLQSLNDGEHLDVMELILQNRDLETWRFLVWLSRKERAARTQVTDKGNGDGVRVGHLSGAACDMAGVTAILRGLRNYRGPLQEAGYELAIVARDGSGEIIGLHEALESIE